MVAVRLEYMANLPKMTLRILTQNLWFDQFEREARMRLHIEQWRQLNPDIIAVQEATLVCLRCLLPLISNYWSSVSLESSAQWQGIAVFSKVEPLQVEMLPLPGEMGRRLLRVSFENLEVGVVHLESTASAGPTRALQLQTVFHQLQKPDSLLLGDFNFCSTSAENAQLPADYIDMWAALHPSQPGWTLDGTKNKHLRGCKQSRYDRMLLRSSRWKPRTIELCESEASDHFGLISQLDLQVREQPLRNHTT